MQNSYEFLTIAQFKIMSYSKHAARKMNSFQKTYMRAISEIDAFFCSFYYPP